MKLSVLDLAPIPDGSDAAGALAAAIALARHTEALGFDRYWMAEHHGMPGIASAATAVALAAVGAATSTIRIGAGGIMLPNHAPLVVAEQFGTLAALYPGRVDLGLGRAPGTDQATAQALRRTLAGDVDQFPRDVVELMGYLGPPDPARRVRAIPGEGSGVPVWILGSSLFGAQLAAMLGLPYAFASHFAPAQLDEALAVYRARFRPSPDWPRPHVMLGFNVFAADTDAEGRLLASSLEQAFVNLRTGAPTPLPRPVPDYADSLPEPVRRGIAAALACSAIGSPETVRRQVEAFVARTGADELMITSQIHDQAARRRSFEIVASLIG